MALPGLLTGPIGHGRRGRFPPPVCPVGGRSDCDQERQDRGGAGSHPRYICSPIPLITEGEVKNHISSVLRKLDLRDRTQLAVWVGRQPR